MINSEPKYRIINRTSFSEPDHMENEQIGAKGRRDWLEWWWWRTSGHTPCAHWHNQLCRILRLTVAGGEFSQVFIVYMYYCRRLVYLIREELVRIYLLVHGSHTKKFVLQATGGSDCLVKVWNHADGSLACCINTQSTAVVSVDMKVCEIQRYIVAYLVIDT